MGLAVGLVGGLGLFLVWRSFWVVEVPDTPRPDGPFRRAVASLRDLLVQAGLGGLSVLGLAALSVGAFVLGFLVLLVITRTVVVALVLGAVLSLAPVLVVRQLADTRRERLREVWPEVVDHLASGIRAGLSLPEALAQVGEKGPEELREPFTIFSRDFQASGDFGTALDRLKDRMADPVADRIVEALRLTREVGGTDLGRLLRTLSAFLREDAATRGELQARQSWTVSAARLALAAPWVVLALMASRADASAAYNSATGVVVVIGGALVSVLAYWVMTLIARLPVDERVLR
jgi:tight adherence protein B